MSYDDDNPYYQPQDLGLVPVAEIEYSNLSYVFDTRVVWYSPDRDEFFTARDAGCSCPTPFEDYCAIEKLTKLDKDNLQSLLWNELQTELHKDYGVEINERQALEFYGRVRRAVLYHEGLLEAASKYSRYSD